MIIMLERSLSLLPQTTMACRTPLLPQLIFSASAHTYRSTSHRTYRHIIVFSRFTSNLCRWANIALSIISLMLWILWRSYVSWIFLFRLPLPPKKWVVLQFPGIKIDRVSHKFIFLVYFLATFPFWFGLVCDKINVLLQRRGIK